MSPRDLLAALGRSSLQGGALLLLLWSVTRLWPRMPAAPRRWLWWLGSLRLILGLLPIPRVPLSFQPAWQQAAAATSEASARVAEIGDALGAPLAATREAVVRRGDLWALALLALWAAGSLFALGAMTWRLFRLRRQWRAAQPFGDPRARAWRAEWRFALGASRTPEIRIGAETRVPLAVGIRRPGILLPAGSEKLSDDALRLVLAHELSHLRRRDPLLGWIPAIAQTLFWFHPLARLATREYVSAREELCDADALRVTGAPPRDYGQLLLDYAVGNHSVLPGTASCGTPAGRRLKRRLEMLSRPTSSSPSQRMALVAFVAAFAWIGFAPVRLSAFETDGTLMNGTQRVREKPSPVGYMLKTAGQTGTRGSIDLPIDLDAARDLDRWNRTALYVRFGHERWITYDAKTIAEVRQVLEEEDRFDARETGWDKQRDGLDRDEQQIERRLEALESRKDALDDRKSRLEDRRQQLRDAGKSTASLDAEMDRVRLERDGLSRRLDEVARAHDGLSKSQREFEASDKAKNAERNAIERRTMAQIERLGRRAIERGVAESYGSGGSSSTDAPRSGTSRFFLPPGTQIW